MKWMKDKGISNQAEQSEIASVLPQFFWRIEWHGSFFKNMLIDHAGAFT